MCHLTQFRYVSLTVLLAVLLCGGNASGARKSNLQSPTPAIKAPSPDAAAVTNPDDEASRHQRWDSCVQLVYPDGSRSVPDLLQQIQEPQNLQDLLKNLKQAWEQDLLLQPAFFDDAVLQKFFAGSAVTWRESAAFYTHHDKPVTAQLESKLLPGMTVSVESRCWRMDGASGSGQLDSSAHLLGSVLISGRSFPGELTLRAIRDLLGPETHQQMDAATVEFGIVHGAEGKGWVDYTDSFKEEAESGFSLGFRFYVPFQPNRGNREALTKIVAEDTANGVELHEKTHRRLTP